VDDFPSKILKALNNVKIKIPGRNQADADYIYQQVVLVLIVMDRTFCELYDILPLRYNNTWGDSDVIQSKIVSLPPPCWRYTMLLRCNVVNLHVYIRFQNTRFCGIVYVIT